MAQSAASATSVWTSIAVQADGYAGYDQLYATNHITEVACWAHFRRKIFDIHVTSPTPLTIDLLSRIASLYKNRG